MSPDILQFTFSQSEIQEAAARLWQWAAPNQVFAFSGSLGAGKTTFIHAICDMLRVEDVVSSPTFALINEYHFQNAGEDQTIYHMDWYRLRDTNEAIDAGMEDTLDIKGAYRFIEWPEKAPELLENVPHIAISLNTTVDDFGRALTAIRHN
jgi:tRNA threonylcarbamoyladenosine biosynthesis protein TsaE